VRLGNFGLENLGSIVVEVGTLRLDQQPVRISQSAKGALSLQQSTTVRADSGLRLDGTVAGFGTVAGDLEPLKQLTPGAAKTAGTLVITGALQLTDATTTTLHVESASSFGRVQAGGQVFLAGKATLTGDYVPAAGDRLEIVSGGAGTKLAGRFASVKFPKPAPASAAQFRVEYAGASASLVARSAIPGSTWPIRPPMRNSRRSLQRHRFAGSVSICMRPAINRRPGTASGSSSPRT
jgi:hypothetical protein